MHKTLSAALLCSFGLSACVGISSASPVKSDEQVIFFPVAGYFDTAAGQWQVPLHGWIFEPEWGGSARQAWRELFDLPLEDEAEGEKSLLRQRLGAFMVDNERGKRVTVSLAGQTFDLPDSAANGHFYTEISLPASVAPGELRYQAVLPANDARRFVGQVYLIAAQGVSVVSDIDDTIKITQVRDKAAMLRNTFQLPFRAAPGMAEAYRRWAGQGAALHYVSASPWQLYPALAEFMQAEGFPGGSFHLRLFRIYDESFAQFLGASQPHKLENLRALLQRYPQRRFVLVGDSGEHDPEIYGEIARSQPGRIARIFIRDVTGDMPDSPRYQAAFRDLPATLWRLFSDGAELPATLAE